MGNDVVTGKSQCKKEIKVLFIGSNLPDITGVKHHYKETGDFTIKRNGTRITSVTGQGGYDGQVKFDIRFDDPLLGRAVGTNYDTIIFGEGVALAHEAVQSLLPMMIVNKAELFTERAFQSYVGIEIRRGLQ